MRTIKLWVDTGYYGADYEEFIEVEDDCAEEDLEEIKLEDIQFNKDFIVSTDDQVEALCILTPTMMNKLKKLKKRTGQVGLLLCKDEMYIALDRNLFEMKSKLKELSVNVFDNLYDDISCILGIAEEIKNNNKVFKMDNLPANVQNQDSKTTEHENEVDSLTDDKKTSDSNSQPPSDDSE